MNTSNQPRGGSSHRGHRGGTRGGHTQNFSRTEPQQQIIETPDHSPISGIQSLIARLGDTYLTLADAEQQNLYNHYHHQFDVSLPKDPVLEPFYTTPTPLHKQLISISQSLKPFVKSTSKEHIKDVEVIFHTIFRSIVAFPTKIPLYAGLVAHIGMESPTFLQKVINETYKQLEASLRGLFVLMLMDDRKKTLTIGGTAKSKAQLQLIKELQLSSTPTTTITTPAITFEALMRFIASLVGYNCIPTSTWTALITALLQLTNIPFIVPRDGNYDSIDQAEDNQFRSFFLPNALPFELANIGSLLEKLSDFNGSKDTDTIAVKSHQEGDSLGKEKKTEEDIEEKRNVYDDESHHSSPLTTSSALSTCPVSTGGALMQYTAFNDIIVHGILSTLVFASRDILNFGPEWNKKHSDIAFFQQNGKTNEALLNRDSILFNAVSNWAITDDSTNPEDCDIELDYDYQGHRQKHVLFNPAATQEPTTQVVIDKITLTLTTIEVFYVNILLAISGYLYHRGTAFSTHSQRIYNQSLVSYQNPNSPLLTTPTSFYNSTFSSHIATTFEFYSEPTKFQYDQTPSPNLPQQRNSKHQIPNPIDTHYFDYLVWSYWAITGSLPDAKIHILRPQQLSSNTEQNLHAWGLLSRPFSITTPSFALFRKDIQQHYITNPLGANKKDSTSQYTFICPGPLDTKTIHVIPSTDMTKSTLKTRKTSKTTTTTAPPKISKNLFDHLPQTYQTALTDNSSQPIYYITQPACFPPLLPLLPHPKAKTAPSSTSPHHVPLQAKYTILANTNNIDVWLTYSYLFYSNITYAGLQEEYFSFLSTLPSLYPVWGESQISLYVLAEGQHYSKYAKPFTSTSLQRSMTASTIPLLLSFFFALLLSTQNNFTPPLTSALLQVDSPTLMHNELTASQSSYFSNILIRFMYEYPSLMPSFFGPRFFQIFKLLQHFSLQSVYMFSTFLANFLCQFNFQFPHHIFNFLAKKNDPTHLQYNFILYTLANCVKLTSFSTVASNLVDLWYLLPPVKYYMDQAEYLKSVSDDAKPRAIGAILNPSSIDDPSKFLLPQVLPDPTLNDAILLLYNSLSAKTPKSIILSTLFASPQSFPQSTVNLLKQILIQFPSFSVAGPYAIDSSTNNNYFTVQQAAAFGLDKVDNVNPYAIFLFLALLAVSRRSNTHFSYYLTNYGDLLALLCNTVPGDLLHNGLSEELLNQESDSIMDANLTTNLVTNLITNSHFHTKPSTLPDQAGYQNGFVQCTLINTEAQPLRSNQTLQPLTAISSIPHPTQIIMMDCLFSFYYEDLSHLGIKLQLLLSNNIISIQSYFIWVLFYLPRYSQSPTTTIFSLNLLELIELGLNLYLMANNEKEGRFIDLFKTTFASVSIQTVQNGDEVTEIIPQNDTNSQISDKLKKILQSHDKITSFKSSIFSTIFALIFDWIAESSTILGVLQSQTSQRAQALREYNPDQMIDEGDVEDPSHPSNKRQRFDFEAAAKDTSEIQLLHGSSENFSFKSVQFLLFIIGKYKLALRNISLEMINTCQIPGLESIIHQVYE